MKLSSLKENLKKFNNKKIAFLGLGLDNQALLSLLDQAKIKASFTICDLQTKNKLNLPNLKNISVDYQLGKNFNQNLNKFDILFRSPGWPLNDSGIQKARKKQKTEITNPLNLFFELCPSKNIIGVSGSKGKGTTASLIYQILKDAKKRVFLGGNIGLSPLSFLKKIKKEDYIILELSSFQLEDLEYSPRLAVITNLFKEHLAPADPHNPNFHSSYANYWQAKLNIVKHFDNKYLIINEKLKTKLKASRLKLKSKIIYFKASYLPSRLLGKYNTENIGAALEVIKILKIPANKYKKTIFTFHNLNHRLEFVSSKNNVKYFDNSFSTTPESTILDLESFNTNLVLIAGGADKGANFKSLAKIIKTKVKFLILLSGTGTQKIKKELKNIKFPETKMREVNSMLKAVKIARRQSLAGDIVLLSTACASFGLFKNYKERGDLFKKYVQAKN